MSFSGLSGDTAVSIERHTGMEDRKDQKMVRLEADSIGIREVPADALYGVQSLRAAENFPITGEHMHPVFIESLAQIKKACAKANLKAGTLDSEREEVIEKACDEILAGHHLDAFIVDPIQGSAGTSMNMNANEVIANLAILESGGKPGDYAIVHPNDHVNMGQSTNDVIPTAGKMTAIRLLKDLMTSLLSLEEAFRKKAQEFDGVIKMGRTQLQDAVPIRLGQEFHAYATAIHRGIERIEEAEKEMHVVNMGATAIGTGLNASRTYFDSVVPILSDVSGLALEQAEDLIDGTQSIDSFASVSSALKNCSLSLSKIANDLRLMSSGPKTGLEEIALPARQNGSSIMPGKVNPVIPEVVSQACFRVCGNDVTIGMAAEAGQLELNAFEPVAFYSLFQSIDVLAHACDTFRINCVEGIRANRKRCRELMESSAGIVTALSPYIGYERAAALAKTSLNEDIPVPTLALRCHILDGEKLTKVLDTYEMTENPDEKARGKGV